MVQISKWKVIFVLAICGLGILLASPNAFKETSIPSWLPSKQMNLGLDLKGGAHLLLEAKVDEALKEGLTNLQGGVRIALRRNPSIGYVNLSTIRNGVSVTVRDEKDVQETRRRLQEVSNQMLLDRDGNRFTLRFTDEQLRDRRTNILEQAITIIGIRVNELGVTEPTIQRQGADRILVQVPGVDPEELKTIIGKTAKMNFHLLDPEVRTFDPNRRVRPGVMLLPSDDETEIDAGGNRVYYLVKKRISVSGEHLVDAQPTVEQGRPVVSFRFDPVGARRFGNVTRRNVEKPFAVVLDNKVISAPVIREAILGGNGIISGNFTTESANSLALLLRSGALPVPLTFIEERSVGPTLGSDNIKAGKIASIFGLIAVAVFMVLAYGGFGAMAVVALALNLILIAAALSLLQATLTLPGIAGIVLTIGMAVDANVLVFERIREEQRAGRTPISAIDAGYSRALTTIIDANLTTFIAALLLYLFGSGPVKGFAVTLAIGLCTSMFSALMVTRLMVITWLRQRRPQRLPI
ncbi:MAG: protein translocase subunit SecD [Rhodospirillaceae bacterium]|nr:protein translocase subunit SecD [Rhodospirillaceae bacterium]|tara:strand:+ start:33148 stop:34716 length:1569 start_codon:yes stop_codon:yes gene_type:complete